MKQTDERNGVVSEPVKMIVGEDGILKISDLPKVMAEFRKALPKEAEQFSEGSKTSKGYDTAGYGYAWLTERMNDVVGFCWRLVESEPRETSNTSKSGNTIHVMEIDVVLQLGNWIVKEFEDVTTVTETNSVDINSAPNIVVQSTKKAFRIERVFQVLAETPIGRGWHKALNIADAKKGAMTNGLKKAAGFWGIGNDAYKKMIDDENKPPAKADRSSSQTRRVDQTGGPVNVPGKPSANLKKIKDILAKRGVTSDQEAIEHLKLIGFDTKTMNLSEKQEKMVLVLLLQKPKSQQNEELSNNNPSQNDGNNQTESV